MPCGSLCCHHAASVAGEGDDDDDDDGGDGGGKYASSHYISFTDLNIHFHTFATLLFSINLSDVLMQLVSPPGPTLYPFSSDAMR